MKEKLSEIDGMLFQVHTYLNEIMSKAEEVKMTVSELEKLEDIEELMDKARTEIAFLIGRDSR